jgi:NAD(P)-dependent dehydrogenase (short-subunit alcohol dehydrogenase family)/acyl dehydratase/putative sterol carrier protein
MGLFTNKVVVITGAGGGLGRAHALAFAREGAKVVVNDLGGKRDGTGGGASMADAVVAEIKKSGGQAVANYDSVATRQGAEGIVATALREFGRIDVMVNNAGILRDKTLLKLTDDLWDVVIDVHLKGTYLCTQAAARAMVEQGGGGAIVNTTSLAGLKGNYGQTNYAAAKAGIYGITMVASMELSKHGISVNAVAPIAKTRLTEDIAAVSEELVPEMISPAVLLLASNRELNGRVLGVHGRHVFEYKMMTSDGVRGTSDWTPSALESALAEITRFGGAPSATPAPAPVAASPATPTDRIADIFARMPAAFLPDAAKGWKAVMHFVIAGADTFTVDVANGVCKTSRGAAGTPTCVVKTDSETFLGMIDGKVDGQQAFMSGKVTATNLGDLMKYKGAFAKERAAAAKPVTAASPAPASASAVSAGPVDRIADIFARMPAAFLPDVAKSWKAVMHFVIAGADTFTVEVANGACKTSRGAAGSPTCVVKTDAETFLGMVDGKVDGQQAFMSGKVTATNLGDLMKYKTAFSKERAGTSAQAQASAAARAPAASAPSIDAAEAATHLPDCVAQILPPLPAGSTPLAMTLSLGGATWRLHWNDGGAKAERDPKPDANASRFESDAATFAGLVDGTLDAAEAWRSMRAITTRMADFQRLARALEANNWTAKIGEALSRRPVSVSRELEQKTIHGAPFVLKAEHARAYAAATNDEASRVPALLPVRYYHDLAKAFLTDPGVKCDLLSLVHGEQEMISHAPLHVGDVLSPKVSLAGVEHKESGSLLRVRFRLMREGELVHEAISSYFVRRRDGGGGAKQKSAARSEGRWDFEQRFTVAADQAKRYAGASGDNNPIHVNEDMAKAAGFRGCILHGLCTLAFASQAVVQHVAARDVERLSQISARFSKPVLLGDQLLVRGRITDRAQGATSVELEVINQDGETVMTGGRARVRS